MMKNEPLQSQKPDRWWDIPAALILLVAIYIAAHRINATGWTDELNIIFTVAIAGLIGGLALGQSNFDFRRVRTFAIIYGIFIIIWQLGSTFGANVYWGEILSSLMRRLLVSIENLLRRRAVTDPILFLSLISILYWTLSCYAGYSLTRYANPWRATLPMGLALFIIHINDPYFVSRSWLLAAYIFLALLLLSRASFLHKQATWRKTRTHMPPYIGLDLLRVTLFAGALIILLSWTAPAMAANIPPAREAWQTIARPWYEARSKMTNAFASLKASVGVTADYYGEVQPLGRGNSLTDEIIMTVKAPVRKSGGVRYYWSGRSYDTFDGASWNTTTPQTTNLVPDTFDLPTEEYTGRWETEFTFIAGIPMNTVYTPPHLTWISRPVDALFVPNEDAAETVDLLSVAATPRIRPGDVYDTRALITNVTISQLRAAGEEYPDWVTERYLQMPDSITPRTRELAQQIAEGLDNPYDIAEAVTQYMRDNITYTDFIDIPPPDQDIIDWILFDYKQGFCNYYATSEIMLLRSLGIPTRISFGYAQGERDPNTDLTTNTNTYTVRQKDAHSWPEVYFPGIGWVEFEPTMNQSPLRRPIGDPTEAEGVAPTLDDNTDSGSVADVDREAALSSEAQANEPILDEDNLLEQTNPFTTLIWFLIPGALILAISFIAWKRNQLARAGIRLTPIPMQVERSFRRFGLRPPRFLKQWSQWANLPAPARAYLQINRTLTLLGAPPATYLTPAERADNLIGLLPNSKDAITLLLREYQVTIYATNGTGVNLPQTSLKAAREIFMQGWQARLRQFIARFQEPEKRKSIV